MSWGTLHLSGLKKVLFIYSNLFFFSLTLFLCTSNTKPTFCLRSFWVVCKNKNLQFCWMCPTVHERNKHAGLASGCPLCILVLGAVADSAPALYVLEMVLGLMSTSYTVYEICYVLFVSYHAICHLPHSLLPLQQLPYLTCILLFVAFCMKMICLLYPFSDP